MEKQRDLFPKQKGRDLLPYHDIFPYIILLQFGGGFPLDWGNPDLVELECMDRANAVKIELKRIKE
jgi:uncharacterized repeat protein (TIGR04076 family)